MRRAAALMTSAPLMIAFLIFQPGFIQSFLRAGNPLGTGCGITSDKRDYRNQNEHWRSRFDVRS
jgi:hypothetical protein